MVKSTHVSQIHYKSSLVLLVICVLGVPAWSQSESESSQAPVPAMVGANGNATPEENYSPDSSGDRMMTPPPVSGQAYPVGLTSEERANYIRTGVSFTGAYSDNPLGFVTSGHHFSDIGYSIAPIVSLDQTIPRVHYVLSYAPGFTFYQKTSSRNEADQNASIDVAFRLTPHVTLSATDRFQRSSSVFNQSPDLAAGGIVSGGTQGANFSIVTPLADRLSNFGNIGLNYQFGLNDMVGASGSFSTLHFPNPSEVPGLYDSGSVGGIAFYSHRLAKSHYIGAAYGYQRLVAYPVVGLDETQTHALLLFYTIAPTRKFSISFFGGPQLSSTIQPTPLRLIREWTPAAGASLGWQSRLNSFALSYSHFIAAGGGLAEAVQLDSTTASVRQKISRTLSVSVSAGYYQNNVLNSPVPTVISGHSISGSVSVQQQLGPHVNAALGYDRLDQSYSNTAAGSTNREFVSISYLFSKGLGR